ncbi:MAG: hypothetical protein M1544_02550 [Candidatus Marsarchaeota archaeon]|nr:hypothetical protein [Candidatus Marsarchaeota archaeon]
MELTRKFYSERLLEKINAVHRELFESIINRESPGEIESFIKANKIDLGKVTDKSRNNVLIYTLKSNYAEDEKLELLGLFIKNGANPNCVNSNMDSSLAFAQSPNLVKFLSENGATLDHVNKDSDPLINTATIKNNHALLYKLRENGKENMVNNENYGALHVAMKSPRVTTSTLHILISFKLDPYLKTKYNKTALDLGMHLQKMKTHDSNLKDKIEMLAAYASDYNTEKLLREYH